MAGTTAERSGTLHGPPLDCTGLVAAKVDGDRVTYVPVLCGQWSCRRCGYHRYAWLTRQVQEASERYDLTRMLTLTLSTHQAAPEESRELLQRAWRRFRAWLLRRWGAVQFVWVVEFTKAGQAHLHVLVDRYMPQREVSAAWARATGGSPIVDIRRLKGPAAARYVAKYVAKEAAARAERGGSAKGAHVFGRSAGVVFQPFQQHSSGWVVRSVSWSVWSEYLRDNCDVLEDREGGSPRIVITLASSVERPGATGMVGRVQPRGPTQQRDELGNWWEA